MTTAVDIGTLIVRTPGTCGGRPRIAGTRMSIRSIAIDYKAGMTPEKLAEEFPHLTLAQIYAGLAYYYANKDEVEAEIVAYYEECEYLEAAHIAGKLS
ncbi:DUF433 domain-containing protein [Microcoleus sp. herbarium14]|uniref:DUF433 domain-containing protein n=1 Tax=Microcoleus sp. herbarium14 TaxID=3055439 RepID=UPI002FD2313B